MEHVTFEVRHDPLRDELEWFDQERTVRDDKHTWTIELAKVDDAQLKERLHELGRLVRDEGLPDDEERGPANPRPKVELRHAAIRSRRIHLREVDVKVWRRQLTGESCLVGHIGGAENPPLVKVLSRMELRAKAQRIVPLQPE